MEKEPTDNTQGICLAHLDDPVYNRKMADTDKPPLSYLDLVKACDKYHPPPIPSHPRHRNPEPNHN